MENHSSRIITTEDGSQLQIERDPQPLPLPDPKELTALKRRLRLNPHVNLTETAIETAVGLFVDLPRVIRPQGLADGGGAGVADAYVPGWFGTSSSGAG
ncbi:hypothetical protein AB0K16_25510 [Nonomuraea jabiensis]|uniref:hypothetical protein n=1 Tax=Nonomuraea jabiensis TaxID=882448 RepID=UPI0034124F7B